MNTYNITSNGAGDAFGGNKIIDAEVFIDKLQVQINDNVSLSTISRPINDALDDFRKNDSHNGVQKLSVLSMMEALDEEAKLAIASLRILMSDETLKDDEQRVESYSQSESYSPFAQELASAAILKLIEIRNGEESAREYFARIPEQTIPQYIYLQRLATKDYVSSLVVRRLEFTEFTLCALFEKTLEYSMVAESQDILERLRVLKPLTDFKRERIILECVNANDFLNKDYFCLSSEDKSTFDKLRDSLIELIDSSKVPDFKLINILSQLFHYTQYTCEVTRTCLEKKQPTIEEKDYFNNEILKSVLTKTPLNKFENTQFLSPEDLSLALINQTDTNLCSLPVVGLLYKSEDTELIIETIDRLSKQDSIGAKANLLALAAVSSSILSDQEFPHIQIEESIDNYFKDANLTISFIDSIASQFAYNGHVEIAVKLYQIGFNDHLPWLSEPYFSYLNFSHQARQYNTVIQRLSHLSEDEKQQEEITTIYSLLANEKKDYELAATLLRKNIERYDGRTLEAYEKRNLVYLWGQYLETVYQENPNKAHELTNELPSNILDEFFGEYSWRLMFYHSHRIKDIAEKALDWFFDDPYSNAKYYFNLIMHANQNFPDQNWSFTSGKYTDAYHYKESHKSHMKIAVPSRYVKNNPQYLIDNKGAIAEKLNNAQIGNAILLSVKLCTLMENLYPVIAAFRIAQNIMDDDENEVFHILSLPKNATGEEILAEINKLTSTFREQRDKLAPQMKQPLPIDFKYKYLNGQDNIEKAMLAILCKDVTIHITPINEEHSKVGCRDFVIDEITTIYLASMGNNIFNDCTWHMTKPVFESLSRYCSFHKDQWPFYHESHDTVCFESEDERKDSIVQTNIIENLSNILKKAEVHVDNDLDIPLDLKLKFRGLCTKNFLLSIALAEHLEVGYFCIDAGTRNILKHFAPNLESLIPEDFQEVIVSNKSDNIIENLLWLNCHSNMSSMSFDSMMAFIHYGSDEQLAILLKFVQSQFDGEWGEENIVNLIITCLQRMVFKELYSNKTEITEQILVGLIAMLTRAKSITDTTIDILINLLPVPLLLDHCEQQKQIRDIELVRKALVSITPKYTGCISSALKQNRHSTSTFWTAFSDRCDLDE
ncbi:hypothetical protein ERW51_09840 [Aliivibrio finisterrensis]|uniref:hypothetical protein n=1 Tax=Aliivibrio finisterrensis TaxID=511998 RepID=UPI0010229AE9|nr:hypothetical protein [Aliivibrio finisterrensis]RYU68000.1 hypothetical protein ERW54_10035 [Aliivibrio finisterrensis]RYU71668.1 hypothetical protein ERW51_09840 [Aliivibrio finisterrensis]RYU75343.1 hypothetical protein ERW48_08780 [Aliivibrio finisterrensis]